MQAGNGGLYKDRKKAHHKTPMQADMELKYACYSTRLLVKQKQEKGGMYVDQKTPILRLYTQHLPGAAPTSNQQS